MTDYFIVFEANYLVQDDPSAPIGDWSYDFVAAGASKLAPMVELLVTTALGDTWHGRFFGGHEGASLVINGPAPDVLVVVAGGAAYVVNVDAPSEYHFLSIWPVRSICLSPPLGLAFLVSFTGVAALGRKGVVQWEAKNLVSDGFTDVLVVGLTLVVRGHFAPEGREVETILDIATGAVLMRQ